ncbi:GLPGLI family protein [Tenacibaculum sp. SG-28]|uniref:GLPGLI family protein n=1 Tax=Tenacibaculum sp. SG-28 TaxID=754426 RepID=UPI000CF4DDA2|nr:GLPGLI family protein [Tenacibaculum sp. SG-28]PQJ19927.1 ribonuclease Z [Tenacibaculum sp. SG-28]
MKPVTILFLLLLSMTMFSQKFEGKAVYMSKTTMDMSAWGDKMSPQRIKQIKARMKNFLEKTYTLTFDQATSSFKENDKLDAPGGGAGSRWGGTSNGSIYKNIKERKLLEDKEFFGKRFLINEQMEQPDWELSDETKQIGNYTCFKATYTKVNNDFDWSVFRRRKKTDSTAAKEKEKVRTMQVTAWYTMQIPVSAGPADYWGLPGLILELNAGRTTMLCTELTINPEEPVTIKVPSKGKEISREEYNKLVQQKMEEMREMRRGRGGRRR